ncbi:bifunctional aconitate hydratase 2/2-methylisocitrate dehydratase [Telmatospirillum sp.]|uniref:bifunctional aconitate hydratase 2/2-methylisocitrate dehydratase n=1 Tax=Telmatospirillum sp. TaxID=2079197 RepID=UPI00283E5C14|nr:bifunctional aconitate hydratase 2/2-methylisocitrate dehydratase [Telmatospirillum sp.]MDR3438902.1 bifunctional aconitate hydratase 2/2-methylisocitrate dehydratase [Telmatospirillum sp.]
MTINRRNFCFGGVAVTAATALALGAEAKEASKHSTQGTAATPTAPLDEKTSRELLFETYRKHVAERAALGIPPLPLSAEQTQAVVSLLWTPPKGEEDFLLDLISNRVPPGVDDAAAIKATFLTSVAKGTEKSAVISRQKATALLGTMQGGYNVKALIDLMADTIVGTLAADGLKKTLLVFGAFNDVKELAAKGNANAKAVLKSWAEAEWFTQRPSLPQSVTLTVFKVNGEVNTGDLSPDPDAWSRPDIPLHALAMLKFPRADLAPDEPGKRGPLKQIEALKAKGNPIAFVGDVLGTGSSRKSATNTVLWWTGNDIPNVPNKRCGGFVMAGKIAPIFYNTMQDSGALPIEVDVSKLTMGDVIELRPYDGKILKDGAVIAEFRVKTEVLFDSVQAGGRIPLVIGRNLTAQAREAVGLPPLALFRKPKDPVDTGKGYSLAQKIVGRACGFDHGKGIRPGAYCEPKIGTIASQDTIGPLTRDELKDLACLSFTADMVLQSFCHTAAFPKPVDIQMYAELPPFVTSRGGVSLRPGDGVIHSWLNRVAMPDTVGTGGDSHTRYPLGVYFPAGSGLCAFASATGVMPLDMPESVLVRFRGEMQPGITLRDLVNAIPYFAVRQGLLTVEKKGKKNVFSGRILEIEGLPDLKVEQAFEIADASAERSAEACTVRLGIAPVIEYMRSNVALLKWMVAKGYQDRHALDRRIREMERWLANPQLMEPDADADYAAIIDIDLAAIGEPLLACPNDPDDVRQLSEVAGGKIDEAFIGSCQTNIGHFRAAAHILENKADIPTRLWIVPPTRMDADTLNREGYFAMLGESGARIEVPGCSLCFGNQARARKGAAIISTSTRNFPNRMGTDTQVYLGSAELAAIAAWMGKLPTVAEYMDQMKTVQAKAAAIYRYMNFDQMPEFTNLG